AEPSVEERLTGLALVPRRGAARVRERYHVDGPAAELRGEAPSHHVGEARSARVALGAQHLADREVSDGDDELGPDERDLSVEDPAAGADFLRRRRPLAAALRLPRKAARYRGHRDALTDPSFSDAGGFLEPAEERLPRSVRERPSTLRLEASRCLAH